MLRWMYRSVSKGAAVEKEWRKTKIYSIYIFVFYIIVLFQHFTLRPHNNAIYD